MDAVGAKLKDLNPGFDGAVKWEKDGNVVSQVEFFTDNDILGADATDTVREFGKSLGEVLKKLRRGSEN